MQRHGRSFGWVLGCAVLALGCEQKPEACKSWSSDSTGAGWSQCGDGKSRKLDCPPATIAGQPQLCTCDIDGTKGNNFELAEPSPLATLESSTKLANQRCGWKITR